MVGGALPPQAPCRIATAGTLVGDMMCTMESHVL